MTYEYTIESQGATRSAQLSHLLMDGWEPYGGFGTVRPYPLSPGETVPRTFYIHETIFLRRPTK